MRKSLLIIFGIVCCLFFAGGGETCAAREAMTQLSIDRASDDQWLCEQEYNSDLNLPRVCGETAVPSAPSVVRNVISDAGRTAAARAAVVFHPAGLPKETSYQKPFDPVSGPCAVDYYVFRLRRIII